MKKRLIEISKATILKYACSSFNFDDVDSPIFDFIVTDRSLQIRYGVKVESIGYEKTNEYKKYISMLGQTLTTRSDNRIPIILLTVDDNTWESNFGFVLAWNRGIPILYKELNLRKSNAQSWTDVLDHLYSMGDVIRVLNTTGLKVLNKIDFSENSSNKNHCVQAIYFRDMGENYKMNNPEVKSGQDQFERLVYGLPFEDYPNDKLDECIDGNFNTNFNTVKWTKDLMLFTSDLANIQHYRNKFIARSFLVFRISDEEIIYIQGYIPNAGIVKIPIDIVVSSSVEKSDFDNREIEKIVSPKEWFEIYSIFQQKKDTMHYVAEFFN